MRCLFISLSLFLFFLTLFKPLPFLSFLTPFLREDTIRWAIIDQILSPPLFVEDIITKHFEIMRGKVIETVLSFSLSLSLSLSLLSRLLSNRTFLSRPTHHTHTHTHTYIYIPPFSFSLKLQVGDWLSEAIEKNSEHYIRLGGIASELVKVRKLFSFLFLLFVSQTTHKNGYPQFPLSLSLSLSPGWGL